MKKILAWLKHKWFLEGEYQKAANELSRAIMTNARLQFDYEKLQEYFVDLTKTRINVREEIYNTLKELKGI